MSVFGAFAEDFGRIGITAAEREGASILGDVAAREAESVASRTAARQGASTLERLGLSRVSQTFNRNLSQTGGFLIRATDRLVTPSRIVAGAAGGSLILSGLGVKEFLANAQSVNLGLGGLNITGGPNGGVAPPGGAPQPTSNNFSPQNVAIGGTVAIVIILGIAYLATRKRK